MSVSTLTAGQVLGRYRIVAQIGVGGMGVVYRAFDERLERYVALKVLLPGVLPDNEARQQFRKEALTLSKLNHPNIATIHDFDTQYGTDFLVMELVSGKSLDTQLFGALISEKDTLALGVQIAKALEQAHEQGIAHRDLKPANVMITTEQHVKVLDFGLARLFRLTDSATTEGSKEIQALAGTLPYMAPEVLRGRPADARSDIWSFGVVLYEMCAGIRPFNGQTAFELSSSILHYEPQPLPSEHSSFIQSIVNKCLHKDPGRRYQRGSELRAALEVIPLGRSTLFLSSARKSHRWTFAVIALAIALTTLLALLPQLRTNSKFWFSVPHSNQTMQLAVLPLSPTAATDDSTAAFGNGLIETLTTSLTRLTEHNSLQVIPATEVRAKGVTTLDQARQEFGVNFGLELSVHRAGELIRTSYILVDAATHKQVTGVTLTAPASDPFGLEDKVAESVVHALQIQLGPQDQHSLQQHGTIEPAAYDYYLQGRGYLQDYQKPENIESAITVLNEALSQDPRYALAFAGLGEAYWRKYEIAKGSEWATRAVNACEHSAALRDEDSEGHRCLGLVYSGTGKYEQAINQYERALELEPTSDDAVRGLALSFASLGKTEDAEKTYRRAIELRPNYWRNYNSLGAFYLTEGHYPEAAHMFSQATTLAPDSFRGYSNLGGTYILMGRYADAVQLLERSISIRPTADSYSNLGTAYFRLRKFADASRTYKSAASLNPNDYVVLGNLGESYYYGGKRADSVDAFQNAIILAKSQANVNPQDASVLADLANYYSMVRDRQNALAYADRALAATNKKSDPEVLFTVALVHNQFGETDAALEWLTKALDAGFSRSVVDDAPALDNLRSTSRFRALVGRK